jgi:hypothetical protein
MRSLLLLVPALALAQPPLPTYEAHRAPSRITVDGKLDDKAWSAAAGVELIFPWDAQTGAKQKTTFRVLWDDSYLYVAYDCEDRDIVAQFSDRDDPTYRDDAVEVFLNPRPSQTGLYYGLEMNARAVLYDYLMYDSRYAMKRFNFKGVLLASHIRGTLNTRGDQDEGWTLEVAIPWDNFDEFTKRPAPGESWTMNVNRWDGVEPNRRMSNWSDPQQPRPNPHVPARFGKLVFVQ